MKIIEIGTGYTSIPAKIGAATEIVIENLLIEFNKRNIDNDLIDISFLKKNKRNEIYKTDTLIHLIHIPAWLNKISDRGLVHYLRRIVYSIKTGIFIRNYLKNKNEEIFLHFHNQINFLFFYLINRRLLKRNRSIKTIFTVHSPGWSTFSRIPGSLLLERFSITKSSIVIALTPNIKNQIVSLISNINPIKISIIPNGVNTNLFKRVESIPKEKVILNIGSICRRKNQLETIILLSDFLLQNSFIFKFAGKIIEQDYFDEINLFVQKHGLEYNIQYLGEIKPGINLVNLLNSSKIYISNSKCEAFSLVILESLACGLPVILSLDFDKSLNDYKNDSYLQICSNDQFIEKIVSFVQDEIFYEEMSSNANIFANSIFSWSEIVSNLIQILNDKCNE